MKIFVLIITFGLFLTFVQKPLQAAQNLSPAVLADEHSHGHEFQFTDFLSLIWTGNVEHDHSHGPSSDDSSHTHSHHHQVPSSISFLEFASSEFHFSFSQFEQIWSIVHARAPQDPFLSRILRPPIA